METEKTQIEKFISGMTDDEKAALLASLQNDAQSERTAKRDAYEALRSQFVHDVAQRVAQVTADVTGFKRWLDEETGAFTKVMREYGALKKDGQQSYTIADGDFKLELKFNEVKGFDERANLAAERLVGYLRDYMQRSDKGEADPMYQMAMTLLERNKKGDLDYKSISKLYSLEDKFDEEYQEIMRLFKEANVTQTTATNYYFSQRDPETGIWRRIEPSFCRL